MKLHFAIDARTKEVVSLEISTDDVHDVKAFPGLVEEAEKRGESPAGWATGPTTPKMSSGSWRLGE